MALPGECGTDGFGCKSRDRERECLLLPHLHLCRTFGSTKAGSIGVGLLGLEETRGGLYALYRNVRVRGRFVEVTGLGLTVIADYITTPNLHL